MTIIRASITKSKTKSYDSYVAKGEEISSKLETMSKWRIVGELQMYIPEDYRYPLALSSFLQYFKNGRVRNITDAVNLYEEELHRMKMQNLAQANAHYSQQAAINAAWAAVGAFLR